MLNLKFKLFLPLLSIAKRFNNYSFQSLSGFASISQHAVLDLMVIRPSNGARRHRVVCWLWSKWTIFDLQLCSPWGQAASWAYWEEEAGEACPIVVGNLPLYCPHHRENARKWSSETLPDVALSGKRVLMERSGRVPDQRGQGPGGTSQRPYVQLSPECDTVASASLPLINKGRAGLDSVAKCWGDCGTGLLCQLSVRPFLFLVWNELNQTCIFLQIAKQK